MIDQPARVDSGEHQRIGEHAPLRGVPGLVYPERLGGKPDDPAPATSVAARQKPDANGGKDQDGRLRDHLIYPTILVILTDCFASILMESKPA